MARTEMVKALPFHSGVWCVWCVYRIPWAGLEGLAPEPAMDDLELSVFLPPLVNSELAGMHHSA